MHKSNETTEMSTKYFNGFFIWWDCPPNHIIQNIIDLMTWTRLKAIRQFYIEWRHYYWLVIELDCLWDLIFIVLSYPIVVFLSQLQAVDKIIRRTRTLPISPYISDSKTITNSAFVLRKHIIIGHNYTSRKFVLKNV